MRDDPRVSVNSQKPALEKRPPLVLVGLMVAPSSGGVLVRPTGEGLPVALPVLLLELQLDNAQPVGNGEDVGRFNAQALVPSASDFILPVDDEFLSPCILILNADLSERRDLIADPGSSEEQLLRGRRASENLIAWLEARDAPYPTLRDPNTGEGTDVSVGPPEPLRVPEVD